MKLLSDASIEKFKNDWYRRGWTEGQEAGIHLQPEFTQKFFSKIRLNPDTKVYEIPHETYTILKAQMSTAPKESV